MSTFFVLPSRHHVGQRFREFLTTLYPGLTWFPSDLPELAEALSCAALGHADTYVVYRDDLIDGELDQVLMREFGAEQGDTVIEVQFGLQSPDTVYRHRVIEPRQRFAA